MKPVNLLRDIREPRSLADQAQAIADRYAHQQAVRLERRIGITYIAPTVRRHAA